MSALLTHILIVFAYGLASAAVAVAASQVFLISGAAPWLIGGGAFLLCAQIHAALARLIERGFLESELADLRRSNLIMSEELEGAQRHVSELSQALTRETEERKRAHATEREVLEELVERTLAAVSKAGGRRPGELPNYSGGDEAGGATTPARAESSILETVRDAVEQNRIDVFIQPIVSLPQRRLRYYEAFTRMRDRYGEELPAAQYIHTAEKAGLVSSIDSLLTFRCVQMLRKLTVKQKEAAIFCNISPHTLRDLDFFPEFLDYLTRNRDLRNHLIFELPQATVENAMETEERHMARLGELGYALSMDHVTHLQLDLMKMKARNFRYVKAPAELLIETLRSSAPADENDGERDDVADRPFDIHAEDFKELLTRYGVDLIAEKLETEAQVVEVLDLAVDFGQGYLFGGPRPTRESDNSGAGGDAPPKPRPLALPKSA